MRKSTKLLLGIGAAIATPVIINHVIAKKAASRIERAQAQAQPDEEPLVYNWEYGNIRYVTKGEGKPLLLLHGIYPGACGMEWEDVTDSFAEDYKVYVLDLLGFGYSSKPAIDYCGYLYVRLIKDFAENVIGQPVTAMASVHTAAALASCAALNPEDFEKIVLVSPTGLEAETPLAQDEDNVLKKILESPVLGTSFYNALCSKKALTALFFEEEGQAHPLYDEEFMDRIYLAAHSEGAAGKHALAALLGKFFNTDIKQTLAQLEMPYHIIVGDSTPVESGGFSLYSGMDDSYEAHVIENGTMFPHAFAPEEFYDTCKGLIDGK